MDADHPLELQIATPLNTKAHISFTKSKAVSRLLNIFVILSMFLIVISCSRSPYQGSAAYDCEGGDRVILNERLFCVYTEPRYTREMPTDMNVEGSDDTTSGIEQGDMFLGETEPQTELAYCPQALPTAYRYETLTLCVEGEIAEGLIEAIVATWNELYNESAEPPNSSTEDMDLEDNALSIDASMVTDSEETTEVEIDDSVSDMGLNED